MGIKQPSVEKQIEELLADYQKYNNELVEKTVEEYSQIISISETCNILIIGKTGVGKSTLVNSVFREELAKEGAGKPVTQQIQQYGQENCPIIIYDTAGLELTEVVELPTIPLAAGDIGKVKQDVRDLIEKYRTNVKSRIHIIWYCVNSRSNRFEDLEETWIRELQEFRVPIVLVLTNTFPTGDNKFFNALKMMQLPIKEVIPVLAKPYIFNDSYTIPIFGLDRLIATSTGTAATTIASNFLKAIPGIGTVTGEVLSTIAASTLTGAFGTSLVKTLKTFRTRQVRTNEMTDEVKKILIDSFIQEYQNYLDHKNV